MQINLSSVNWSEIILWALTNAVFTSAAIAALAYISRSLIDRWLSRNLEKYKTDLQAANARELERLRADLKLAGFEYEIRFAELHKKQAQVIAEFYALLVIVEEKVRWMGSILVGEDESELTSQAIGEKRAEEARRELNDLIDFYRKNRLYFRESTCRKINVLLGNLQETFMNFKAATFQEKIDEERWRAAQTAVAQEIPETLILLA